MTERDKRAEYLESGSGEVEGSVNLDRVRRTLRDPVTWGRPPQSVGDGVLAEIQAEAGALRPAGPRPGWPRLFGAAAALLIVLTASILALSSLGGGQTVTLSGTELEPAASGIAVLDATGSGWSIRLDISELPPAEDGYYYEGWVWNDRGEGVSIGTFHLRSGSQTIDLWAGVDVAEYPSIWISRQSEGGGAEVSDEIVMRGKLDPPG